MACKTKHEKTTIRRPACKQYHTAQVEKYRLAQADSKHHHTILINLQSLEPWLLCRVGCYEIIIQRTKVSRIQQKGIGSSQFTIISASYYHISTTYTYIAEFITTRLS